MRKLFTLLVSVLLAGNAFGQATWTPIVSSDMESEDPDFVFFDARDYHESTDQQSSGRALIVEDPADPTNHCIKVVIRSEAEADAAAGTPKTLDWQNLFAGWDTQFFIAFKNPVPAGKQIRLTMRVKGENASQFRMQCHRTPSDYIGEGPFPTQDVQYTTEWTRFSEKVDVTATISPANDTYPDGAFQSLAFNLTRGEANVFYLDDVVVEIKDQKPVDPTLETTFIDFLRKGMDSDDIFDNGTRTFTNFTARDYITGNDVQAEIVNDPIDGLPAIKIEAPDLVEVDDLDADGNQQTDEEGNIKKKKVYLRTLKDTAGNDSIVQVAPDDWLSQFFVTVNHVFQAGEKFTLRYAIRADKATSADGGTNAGFDAQAHRMPSDYVHWSAGISSRNFTTEWTPYDEVEVTMPNEVGGQNCQTIAFNLYKMKEANAYYFRFYEFSFTAAKVTDKDRTLGSKEIVVLADNSDEGLSTKVDLADMLAAFGESDFKFAEKYDTGDGLKFQVCEVEDGDTTTYYSAARSFTNGGFVNAEGYEVDGEYVRGINITLNEDEIEGSVVPFDVWTDPDSGISFADGKIIKTNLCFAKGGWFYVYNVSLMSPETAGIKGVKQVKADNGLIYNLAGQRVDASYKGLVIKNGQKSIQK